MGIEDDANFTIFRDCISVAVIERSGGAPVHVVKKERSSKRSRSGNVSKAGGKKSGLNVFDTSTPAELAEFVDYIAEEAFHTLPAEFRELTYQSLQDDKPLAEKYTTPTTSDIVELVANLLPPSVEDTLLTYCLINPPTSDLFSFLGPILNNYITATTSPPPPPSSTRTSACEICDRDWITLTYHHLIPRAVHAKVLKRGWHPEHKLDSVAWLCRACHSFVHRMAGNEDLAREWFTVERILGREDVQRWRGWVGSVRWKKR